MTGAGDPRMRGDLCIHAALRRHAERAPHAPALLAPARAPMSYGDLWAHLAGACAGLRAQGVQAADRVAIAIGDGPEMALAFLAVSAVATTAPINLSLGRNECDAYFAALGITRLLTAAGDDSAVVQAARGRRLAVMRPQTDGLDLSTAPPHEVPSVRPDQIALALTTSGTTSRPKVVTLTHADIYLAALDTAASVALSESDRLLNIMPLYHSHGLVGGMVTSLSAGASVICSPGFDAVRFFQWMEELEPTWYTAAPTLHQAILARAGNANTQIGRSTLRVIRSTSAALPDAVYRGLEAQFGVPVIQAYALTESAGVVTSNPLPPGVRKVGSVGVPCGIEIDIRDDKGRQVAAGETGEITIRGERVIRAYEKSDDATRASSFFDGWLRTGDSGYIDADGYLYVTGRLKEVINRGGEKINPNEIDAVLIEHAAVEQVCTFGTPHPTLGQDVAAVVVLRSGSDATETDLRQFVAERLVYFKVPNRILFVSSLPTGASGKVPRNTLADRFKADLVEDATKRAPSLNTRSALEATVGKLYEDVLQVASVRPDDSFFDLGGDSMLGAQVIARVNAIVGYRVPLLLLFDNPTVSQFSHAIEGFHAEPEGSMRPMSQRARSADAERSR